MTMLKKKVKRKSIGVQDKSNISKSFAEEIEIPVPKFVGGFNTSEFRILNDEPELTDIQRARKHFNLTDENIFRCKEYPDNIVFITIDGKKLTWPRG